MRLRGLILLLVVAAAAVTAGTVTPEAHAFYGTNPIYQTDNWPQVNTLLRQQSPPTTTAAGGSTFPSGSTARTAWHLATKALRGPVKFNTGTLTLGAAAVYVGYKLPALLGVDRWVYGKISGLPATQSPPGSGTYRAYVLQAGCASGGVVDAAVVADGTTITALGGCVWVPNVKYSSDSGATYPTTFTDGSVRYTGAGCSTPDGGSQDAILAALSSAASSSSLGFNWSTCFLYSSYYRKVLYARPSALQEAFTPTEQRDFVSASDTSRTTITGTSGATGSIVEAGSAEADDALDAIETSPALATYLGKLIDPTWEGETEPPGAAVELGTLTLPQPEEGETALEYRARLRALGFLGTITLTEAAELPELDYPAVWGPLEPVRIKIGSPTTTTIELDVPWPYQPGDPDTELGRPTIDQDEPIEIEYVPDTTTPRDPDEGETFPPGMGVPGGGGGTCDPWLSAELDLSPLLDLELGDSFPFGVPAWLVDQADQLVASPEAPSWAINVPSVGADYEIDLEPFDDYMSTMRTVLSWLLWVGTVWYVGASVLGFRGTGNPAEAMDDYIDGIV